MRKRTRLNPDPEPLPSCDGGGGGEEGEWGDWANLPEVLIDHIACRLLRHDVSEYLRLRAACKEWRKCTADPREAGGGLDSRFRPRNWIMLSHRSSSTTMLMVRYYCDLAHLGGAAEQRRVKRRKRMENGMVKVEVSSGGLPHRRRYSWRTVQVFAVDLAEKRLVRLARIGGSRALFVGYAGCLCISTKRFPSVAGNAVYWGVNSLCSRVIGVHYLGGDNKKGRRRRRVAADSAAAAAYDPPFEFALEAIAPVVRHGQPLGPRRKMMPRVRPCALHEYLVAYAGVKGGLMG